MLVLALVSLASACATPEPQHHHRGHRDGAGRQGGGGRFGGASLFVSPAGEPFRGGADDIYPVGRWFAQVDADHDGRLTPAEFRADALRYFHTLDLNGDGVIDGSEVTAYEHNVLPEILAGPSAQGRGGASEGGWNGGQGGGGAWGGGRHGGGGGGHRRGGGQGPGAGQAPAHTALQGAGPYTLNRQAEPVSSADGNFDGKITLAEFLAAADRHFAELDTQGTGYLTEATLPKTVAQERSERRGADHD